MGLDTVKNLSEEQISQELKQLDGWTIQDGKLHRLYKFDDFAQAFGFMAQVAIKAEGMNHHPDWSNVYNRLVVYLSTHDTGGITANDIRLAAFMNKAAPY